MSVARPNEEGRGRVVGLPPLHLRGVSGADNTCLGSATQADVMSVRGVRAPPVNHPPPGAVSDSANCTRRPTLLQPGLPRRGPRALFPQGDWPRRVPRSDGCVALRFMARCPPAGFQPATACCSCGGIGHKPRALRTPAAAAGCYRENRQ